MAELKTTKKLTLLIQDLNSTNPSKVTNALDAMQVYGNQTIIEPLFKFILETANNKAKSEVIEFLSNLKDSASKKVVIENLLNKNFSTIQNEILSTIWNSPLDYSDFLSDFVKIAVENEFLTTLECLTVIENLEGPFEEKQILESQLILKDYRDGKFSKSKEKDTLISEIAIFIKEFDIKNQEFD